VEEGGVEFGTNLVAVLGTQLGLPEVASISGGKPTKR
jgi:hypothetical protein